ncbi:hypothetical protein [Chryseobacterium luteum]|uniref:Uncharacterized protein n=1 Tax=Chryseobacterium luteum TaxID=421531 RepID=A0A085YXK1_9FLAO|nr:hypothetical protein [Chryseobacterium luteum]KFE96914.1 hypothetical protein IX38_22615 [Chryseobacterium luteum]
MGSEQYIFSLYITSGRQYFLFRTVRPYFSNSSQNEEDESSEYESAQRNMLISYAGNLYAQKIFALVGELHGYPIGDIFYSDYGKPHVPVYYMQTDFGEPWIVFGTADSEEGFLTELENDEDLQALNPIGDSTKIHACFITQNDFNFKNKYKFS